ncbi:MAG: hypothetical protein FWG10_07075 [Eubacteriaceae bacterium]|nr:hypothetical protein [Eubacteriaceae bacterium]
MACAPPAYAAFAATRRSAYVNPVLAANGYLAVRLSPAAALWIAAKFSNIACHSRFFSRVWFFAQT